MAFMAITHINLAKGFDLAVFMLAPRGEGLFRRFWKQNKLYNQQAVDTVIKK